MTTNLGWSASTRRGWSARRTTRSASPRSSSWRSTWQRFVGQSFSAIVSGVSQGGLYARLENTAEGFIPVRTLGDDYFSFDAARYTLTGEETARATGLGSA